MPMKSDVDRDVTATNEILEHEIKEMELLKEELQRILVAATRDATAPMFAEAVGDLQSKVTALVQESGRREADFTKRVEGAGTRIETAWTEMKIVVARMQAELLASLAGASSQAERLGTAISKLNVTFGELRQATDERLRTVRQGQEELVRGKFRSVWVALIFLMLFTGTAAGILVYEVALR